MLTIDGSLGEGGGQILRTSLALSLVSGQPFRMLNIRANRSRPGLLQQHLTAVRAAAAISRAEVTGAELHSASLEFAPGPVQAGDYHFAVGTAGSATLVFQTILPALMLAQGPSTLLLEGGTHNPLAPPFDFLAKAFLPLINRMGPHISAELEQYGFYPAGGGKFRASIEPATELRKIDLPERGAVLSQNVTVLLANLPLHIAAREIKQIKTRFRKSSLNYQIEEVANARGPGNVIIVETVCQHLTEVFSAFGQKGARAESIASAIAAEIRQYMNADVPVGPCLADQLLVPLALAGGGSFRTLAPSRHTLTNIAVIQQFLPVRITLEPQAQETALIKVRPA